MFVQSPVNVAQTHMTLYIWRSVPKRSVYFVIRSKSTAGAVLPLCECDWLNWSRDKGLTYGLCHVT